MSRTAPPARPVTVALALYPGVQSLDVIGPAQVFASANAELGREHYRLRYVAAHAGAVATSAGVALHAEALAALSPRSVHTLLVPGSEEVALRRAIANEPFMAWLGDAAQRARRVCSVCSGAFVLAALGVLDGRRAATHWNGTALLRALHPNVQVDDEAIYVNDGRYWTSAGVTTGIDMCLALVEADLGRDVAMAVARQLVVYMRRPGHQTQFSAALAAQSSRDARLGTLAAWVERHLGDELPVERLAEQVHMSPRNLHRHMREELGTSPAKFVESLRLDAARRMLETDALALGQVAEKSGFSGPDHFIRAFERRFGITPGAYRGLHGASAAPAPPDRRSPSPDRSRGSAYALRAGPGRAGGT